MVATISNDLLLLHARLSLLSPTLSARIGKVQSDSAKLTSTLLHVGRKTGADDDGHTHFPNSSSQRPYPPFKTIMTGY